MCRNTPVMESVGTCWIFFFSPAPESTDSTSSVVNADANIDIDLGVDIVNLLLI